MAENAVNGWLDIAPAYLNFLLAFVRNPRRAFAAVSEAGKVSSDLTSILFGGVALSYLVVLLTNSPQLDQDNGVIASFLRGRDYQMFPLLGVFGAVLLGLVCHLAGKFFVVLSKLGKKGPSGTWDPKLGGSVEDSVNASLGFAAVFVPLTSGMICAVSLFPRFNPGVAGVLLALFAIVYFPWSLSATHQHTGVRQAYMAISGGVVLLVLILYAGRGVV
jgi:hypothetical protein